MPDYGEVTDERDIYSVYQYLYTDHDLDHHKYQVKQIEIEHNANGVIFLMKNNDDTAKLDFKFRKIF